MEPLAVYNSACMGCAARERRGHGAGRNMARDADEGCGGVTRRGSRCHRNGMRARCLRWRGGYSGRWWRIARRRGLRRGAFGGGGGIGGGGAPPPTPPPGGRRGPPASLVHHAVLSGLFSLV